MYSFKFMPKWNPEQIAGYQKAEPDLKLLYAKKLEGAEEHPDWNQTSPLGPLAKAVSDLRRIEV